MSETYFLTSFPFLLQKGFPHHYTSRRMRKRKDGTREILKPKGISVNGESSLLQKKASEEEALNISCTTRPAMNFGRERVSGSGTSVCIHPYIPFPHDDDDASLADGPIFQSTMIMTRMMSSYAVCLEWRESRFPFFPSDVSHSLQLHWIPFHSLSSLFPSKSRTAYHVFKSVKKCF